MMNWIVAGIFPAGLALIGVAYIRWAWDSLYWKRIRTFPRTYIEKANFPVTYWVLFWFYIVFGTAMLLFAVGLAISFLKLT